MRQAKVQVPDHVCAYACGVRDATRGVDRPPTWRLIAHFVSGVGLGWFDPRTLRDAVFEWRAKRTFHRYFTPEPKGKNAAV